MGHPKQHEDIQRQATTFLTVLRPKHCTTWQISYPIGQGQAIRKCSIYDTNEQPILGHTGLNTVHWLHHATMHT